MKSQTVTLNSSQQSKAGTKGQQTRERIIACAAQLFHQQGYHHTGLQQILKASGVTKGAFYFHFSDKQSLALATLEFYQQMFGRLFGNALIDTSLSAWQKITAFHEAVKKGFAEELGLIGCPMGNMSLELAGQDAKLQRALEGRFETLVNMFAGIIKQGQLNGELKSDKDPDFLASFLVNSWEGAVLRMKASQSFAPLDNWHESMELMLLKPEH